MHNEKDNIINRESYTVRYKRKRAIKRRKRVQILIGGTIFILVSTVFIHYFVSPHFSSAALDAFDKNGGYAIVNEDETKDISKEPDKVKSEKKVTDMDPDNIEVLINKQISLPFNYRPEDLVEPKVQFPFHHFEEKKLMRKEAAEALEDLFDAAAKEGLSLYAISGFRSYERQYEIFTSNVRGKGLEETLKVSSMPGYSEHQTGLAMDVSNRATSFLLLEKFANTPEGIWLAENAHEYGYIIRYPKDMEDITGYTYEPWHIRYVGIELATLLYEKDITLEEYYSFIPDPLYFSRITLDNIEEFGIALEDIMPKSNKPSRKPIKPTLPKVEETEETEETTEETNETGDNLEEEGETSKEEPSTEKPKDPTPTKKPTPSPTDKITPTPTKEPSPTPTKAPTPTPTKEPSPTPTKAPTPTPTKEPTPTPTKEPAQTPAKEPESTSKKE